MIGVFIEKNPTASSMKAIHINTRPTKIIVKTAPINNSNPAVLNMFTPVLAERVVNDLLRKMDATTTNAKSTTKLPRIAAI